MSNAPNSLYKDILVWIGSLVSLFAVLLFFHEFLISRLGCTENYGVAFGIGVAKEVMLGINGLVVFALLVVAVWRIYDSNVRDNIYELIGLSLISVGGSLNLYERLNSGFVCDYIQYVRTEGNIADILVIVGCILLSIIIIKNSKSADEYGK